jgi:hypothetical protein
MDFLFLFNRSHVNMVVAIAMVGSPYGSNYPTFIANRGVMSLTFVFPCGMIIPRINISGGMGWNIQVGNQDMCLTSMLLQEIL